MSATNEGNLFSRLNGIEDKLDTVLGWIERQDAMAQAMAATIGEATESPLDAFTTMADVIGLYSSDSPLSEPEKPVWNNDRVIFDELSPSGEIAAGIQHIQTDPSMTAAVARMLLRDKDALLDKRGEYGFDKGYWAAMVDILRHLNAWESAGLKQPIAGDDGRYDGFDNAEDMIRHQLGCFFDAAEAGWGEEFPTFEEWLA